MLFTWAISLVWRADMTTYVWFDVSSCSFNLLFSLSYSIFYYLRFKNSDIRQSRFPPRVLFSLFSMFWWESRCEQLSSWYGFKQLKSAWVFDFRFMNLLVFEISASFFKLLTCNMRKYSFRVYRNCSCFILIYFITFSVVFSCISKDCMLPFWDSEFSRTDWLSSNWLLKLAIWGLLRLAGFLVVCVCPSSFSSSLFFLSTFCSL